MRILLVEDTSALASAVATALRAEGYAVDVADDYETAATSWAVAHYDVVILDLGLPDGSGIELLHQRRKAGDHTAVIIATARDRITDRIEGLDAGADDYLVKPFDLGELAARLRAHARRAQGDPSVELTVAGVRINRVSGRIFREDLEIHLTAREWAVLEALLAARGRILSRAALEERLYDFDTEIGGNAVEVYVSRLRGKIGQGLIETRRGLGYVIP